MLELSLEECLKLRLWNVVAAHKGVGQEEAFTTFARHRLCLKLLDVVASELVAQSESPFGCLIPTNSFADLPVDVPRETASSSARL